MTRKDTKDAGKRLGGKGEVGLSNSHRSDIARTVSIVISMGSKTFYDSLKWEGIKDVCSNK